MPKTTNLQLTVDQETTEGFKEWRSDLDSNFIKIDTEYGKINSTIDTATESTGEWELKIAEVTNKNDEIMQVLSTKVTHETGKSLVEDTLIAKIEADYSKEEIDDTFVTKEKLASTTIKQEDIKLDNYYNKNEVDGLITGGSPEALKNYYTKQEIDDMLIGDKDIDAIIDFLDALNGYELSMKRFDYLNGNGD